MSADNSRSYLNLLFSLPEDKNLQVQVEFLYLLE